MAQDGVSNYSLELSKMQIKGEKHDRQNYAEHGERGDGEKCKI
jgi:hypothetical protein